MKELYQRNSLINFTYTIFVLRYKVYLQRIVLRYIYFLSRTTVDIFTLTDELLEHNCRNQLPDCKPRDPPLL